MMRRRRGVTLLITLSIISVMLALVGVLFGYLESARDEARLHGAYLQSDLLKEDLKRLLQSYLKDHPSRQTLQTLYGTPLPIATEDGAFSLLAKCEPLLNRIPLLWLGWGEKPKERQRFRLAKELFEDLCEKAEIQDSDRLFRMIAQSLKGNFSEFGETLSRQKTKGRIRALQWRWILDAYRFQADDPNVYKIEWEKYFVISAPSGAIYGIEKDFMTPELVAYLYGQDLVSVRAEYVPGEISDYLASIAQKPSRYKWLFEKTSPLAIRCSVQLGLRGKEYNLRFNYRNRRIEDFELGE